MWVTKHVQQLVPYSSISLLSLHGFSTCSSNLPSIWYFNAFFRSDKWRISPEKRLVTTDEWRSDINDIRRFWFLLSENNRSSPIKAMSEEMYTKIAGVWNCQILNDVVNFQLFTTWKWKTTLPSWSNQQKLLIGKGKTKAGWRNYYSKILTSMTVCPGNLELFSTYTEVNLQIPFLILNDR